VLRGCDVGVLSSVSEGLPLALLEYGMAKLPVVATRVGQCAEVLDEGRAGLLVPPGSPAELAEALVKLLGDGSQRREMGEKLCSRVREHYGPDKVVSQICRVYDLVLANGARKLSVASF